MKINENQLYMAINEYIEREIMPLSTSMDMAKQFMFGLKIGIVRHKMQGVIKSYLNKPEMKKLELIDENGNIDIEPIYKSAIDVMSKMQRVEIGEIAFSEKDLQSLYSIIQRYASQGM